jgi:hypothetical protein
MTATEDMLVAAIHDQRVVEFEYGSRHRIAEPHTLGVSTSGVKQLLSYQIGGESRSGGLPDWRRFDLDGILDLTVREQGFPRRPTPSGEHARWETLIAFVPAAGE